MFQHSPIEKAIELPWKTDLFKNKAAVSQVVSYYYFYYYYCH